MERVYFVIKTLKKLNVAPRYRITVVIKTHSRKKILI